MMLSTEISVPKLFWRRIVYLYVKFVLDSLSIYKRAEHYTQISFVNFAKKIAFYLISIFKRI